MLAEITSPQKNSSLDVQKIRQDFPILRTTARGYPLAYLDNAATSQKPQCVIDALTTYYSTMNANVHRGVYDLSEKSTLAYENARRSIQHFIHAKSEKDIIFTRGTTEAINLVAQSYGGMILREGDEILLSRMEHHSNIVPWQLIAAKTGAVIKVIPINMAGEILMEEYAALLNERTRIVGITHISNTLGTINPIEKIIALAHQAGAKVLVDGAQAAPHTVIDVQKLDCDFYCFSGHKMYGPTGIGVLYAKETLLEKMPPYQGGGEMINQVSFEKSTYNDIPAKFEAGTPNIADAIALDAAIQYLQQFDRDDMAVYEHKLLEYAQKRASTESDIRLIGTAAHKAPVMSFVVEGIHPHDIGTIIDQYGVAIRAGHHCTMPLMTFYQIPATARASFAFYNTYEEIDRLFDAIEKARTLLKR
ncbi:MAG: cysteine desulfurase [Legionellales bacterium]|nr:cysteine desulfurase [Legionellales bacterium]